MQDLIISTQHGLYCPAGDFYIDPWRPVDKAVITHAHADHARWGHKHYLAHGDAEEIMRARLGDIVFQGCRYGETLRIGEAELAFYPAGHVLGSMQVRITVRGETWVVSGDYFVSGAHDSNDTCVPFEPVACHCFITESTFGLPIYRWENQQLVFNTINAWWQGNIDAGKNSLLMGYSLGKAQRLIGGLDPTLGPIYVHPAVHTITECYRRADVDLPETLRLTGDVDRKALRGVMVIAPPAVQDSAWARRLGDYSDAFASGWMQLRGARRRRSVDRGFVLSDHADWSGLINAINATGASRVIVTHGYEDVMVRWLREQGLDASSFETEYGDDLSEEVPAESDGQASTVDAAEPENRDSDPAAS